MRRPWRMATGQLKASSILFHLAEKICTIELGTRTRRRVSRLYVGWSEYQKLTARIMSATEQ